MCAEIAVIFLLSADFDYRDFLNLRRHHDRLARDVYYDMVLANPDPGDPRQSRQLVTVRVPHLRDAV